MDYHFQSQYWLVEFCCLALGDGGCVNLYSNSYETVTAMVDKIQVLFKENYKTEVTVLAGSRPVIPQDKEPASYSYLLSNPKSKELRPVHHISVSPDRVVGNWLVDYHIGFALYKPYEPIFKAALELTSEQAYKEISRLYFRCLV